MPVSPETAAKLSRIYFNDELKPAQAEIMAAALSMDLPRVSVLGATQIQKSRAVARALGILASLGIGITIVGPKAEQASTPIQYFIGMMGASPYFQAMMLQGGESKTERLQASENKMFLSFKGQGHIRAITLNERDSNDRRKSALGKGDRIIVFEEASLTSNDSEAMVMRMIAGWGNKGRIIKLGNAITREKDHDHFYRSTLGEDGYFPIKIDCFRAVEEGIYTQEFLDEVLKKPMADQLYRCIFPDPLGLVKGGYTRLFTTGSVFNAKSLSEQRREGRPIVGIDIGQGSPDCTSIVARWGNYAEKVFESRNPDIMSQIGEYSDLLKELNPLVISVDGTGMGAGVSPRLTELGFVSQSVIVGESAPESDLGTFANKKAYGYFAANDWILNGGQLGKGDWDELLEVVYKVRSDKSVIIESKTELQARGVSSYNDAEAFMLTFVDSDIITSADFDLI